MRLSTTLGLGLVVAMMVAPPAQAHVGAMETNGGESDTVPDQGCVPVCPVQMTSVGNAPAVTVIESGGTVSWEVLSGTYHTATSDVPTEHKAQLVVGGESTLYDSCMNVAIFSPQTASATFRIQGDTLEVFEPGKEDPSWTPCEEALPLEDGSFLLSYHCNDHPRFQQSAIVVLPDR